MDRPTADDITRFRDTLRAAADERTEIAGIEVLVSRHMPPDRIAFVTDEVLAETMIALGPDFTWPKWRLYDVQADVSADYPQLEETDEPT